MCVLNIGILEFYITEFLLRHFYHLDPIEANYFVRLEILYNNPNASSHRYMIDDCKKRQQYLETVRFR